MTLDFSNKNPTDPNGIASLDVQNAQDAWVNDGWTRVLYSQGEASRAGANNKVRIATATTNDGHQYNVVISADGTPVSQIGDSTGIDTKQAESFTRTAPKPIPPGASPTQRRVAPDGQTHIYGYNPQTGQYDQDQGVVASPQQAEPPKTEDQGGHHFVWHPNPGGPNAGGAWEDMGPNSAPETPAERQTREANAPTQTVRVETGGDGKSYTVITIVPKPGQPGEPGQIVLGPDGKPSSGGVPGKGPTSTTSDVVVNGTHYTKVVKQEPDGTVSVSYLGPDNKPVDRLPSAPPDNPTAQAPAIPNFVVGGSQEALRTYKGLLQDGVSKGQWSQKWADDRWGEAIQLARTVNEDYATQQRERESTRNAEINLASTKATLGQNAITTALNFVNQINGSLPEGSPMGGQAFAAILGLSMLSQARSGIDTVNPSAKPAPLPTVTTTSIATPQNVANLHAEASQQVAQAVQPPAAPPAVQGTPSALGDTGAPAVPAGPRPSSVGAPPATSLPANRPDQTQVGSQIDNAIMPPAAPGNEAPDDVLTIQDQQGNTRYITRANWDASPAAAQAQYTVVNAENGSVFGQGRSVTQSPTMEGATVVPAQQPAAAPDSAPIFEPGPHPYMKPDEQPYGAPQPAYPGGPPAGPMPRVLPQPAAPAASGVWPPSDYLIPPATPADMQPGTPIQVPGEAPGVTVPYPSSAGAESKALSLPPILAQYQAPMNQPGAPAQQQQAQPTPMMSPAMLASQARSTPPWRLQASDIQQMLDAGVSPDDIWSVPGRTAA